MSFGPATQARAAAKKLMRLLLWGALMASLSLPHAWAKHGLGKLRLPRPPAWGDMGRWDQPQYYATIQLADIDGDGQAELLGRWAGGVLVNHFDTASDSWVARRPGPPLSDSAHWDQPQYYTTIQFADIDGDGQAELVARGPEGIEAWHYDPRTDSWTALETGGPFADVPRSGTDTTRWDQPQYYTTIHLADIDGQPGAELIGRGADGLHAYRYKKETHAWSPLAGLPELNDSDGWNQSERYSTIQLADIDGLPGAELAVRGADGLHIYRYDAKAGNWGVLSSIPELNDADGWNRPERYSSIHLADIDGRPGAELIARAADGLRVYRYEKENGSWAPLASLPDLRDDNRWNRPEYGNTIQFANVDGRPGAELIARGEEGLEVWHYARRMNSWTELARAHVPSLSDANGWNVPQQYLTIQAANIDGRSGAEIIGRSETGIETWRFVGVNSVATEVTGGTGFPPYNSPPQSDYYSYISASLNYGSDIRASYDSLGDSNVQTALDTLSNLKPPNNVPPADSNWLAVKKQIASELSYVETANDWILGTRGSQYVTSQIFTATTLNVPWVESVLTNVDNSSSVAAGIATLLAKIVQGVASLTGFPAASGIASLLATTFSALQSEGLAPNLTIAVGKIDGQLETMYNAANNAANATHNALVTNWSQLQAFAQSRVGQVPTDDDVIQMRWAGEVQYAEWIWQTITPAVWIRVTPAYRAGRFPGCNNSVPDGYSGPTRDLPQGPNPSSGCGPAWIGMTCGFLAGCLSPPAAALTEAFNNCSQGKPFCPDPVNGPFGFSPEDTVISQNGWNLPCHGPGCVFLLSGEGLTAERTREIAEAQHALRSLTALVRTSVSNRELEESLAGPLESAVVVLKSEGSPAQLEFGAQALQNFVSQIKALPDWQLNPTRKSHLITTASGIRSQLTGPAPADVVETRHSRAQQM